MENQTTQQDIDQKTAIQWFYDRVTELKAKLPKDHKMPLLALLPREYDSYKGGVIISNVLNCRTTDMVVLEALEKLVKEGYE